ncbi:DUF1446-domain-containing protein [Neurospora crassa]|uniref:DUF1446-domain-containing protein n=1 Tax=Neurospora crassa (strain ATCC 24698 / 74-OR23-1A / CBS 708.71 / DSM 1257 / FGSC 987) TaxID=367110 RepID=Q7SA16_NEUCR|nr:hypothetical protein NCU07901 [Neurospora crassa OR74A]EAA33181.2 hypothetical protein NCU07901 [Neurospora crassa OR74A]KHE85856.1 DUF1446-domain-containing protein [Neurospora crassa]|eukprot:XP_962417.2 hypothetical protein NCU07901 [Neurospora crassa OR74A]
MAKRPVRIANCSGALTDPGDHMYNQAKYGEVDFITGDYLAELNMANDAEAYRNGQHPGWMPTAWDGLCKSVEILKEKRIKVIINGGCLNPRGLAEKTHNLVQEKKLNLKVAYVEGDDLLPRVHELIDKQERLKHLDAENPEVTLVQGTKDFLKSPGSNMVVSANAYLGIRAIKRGLEEGADIIICGRVSDASPVMAAAAWWHGWPDSAYDELAGSLIAGHLIECSTYVTGANFAGFYKYDIKDLLNLGLPIVEIDSKGECVVTKHEALPGFVTEDTVKCQLLYELQGNIYLNSDVKADITHIQVKEESKNRVHVSGVKGYPPPPTTKFAVFYKGGFQCEITINATGYATAKKYELQEAQVRSKLQEWGLLEQFDTLDFQRIGVPAENPRCQLESTTSLRIFAQAKDAATLGKLAQAWTYNGMAHFAGMHSTLDMRQLRPIPFNAYCPAIVEQKELEESINIIIDPSTHKVKKLVVGPPQKTERLAARDNYETSNPVDLASFGPTVDRPLGDIALARSGDKGANVNIGILVHTAEEWDWLRSFMTRKKMQDLMGTDWKDWYFVERVEMPLIKAVHFVVYGPLGRGVSSSRLLDALGKGFAEFIRAVRVPIPKKFLNL